MSESREEKRKAKKEKKLNRTPLKKFLDFWKNLFFAAIAALLIKTFLIETSRVPTGSMERTIMVGDFLFVNKFIYGSSSPRNIPFTNVVLPYFQLPALTEPEKGDIIVFEYPGDRDILKPDEILNYVKRCVGEPGDTIEIVNKVVYINGEELHRPSHIQYLMPEILPKSYTRPDIFPKGSKWNKDQYGPLVIPGKGDIVKLTSKNIETYRMLINRNFERDVVEVIDGDIILTGKRLLNMKFLKIIILQWEIIGMIVQIVGIGDLSHGKKLLVKHL